MLVMLVEPAPRSGKTVSNLCVVCFYPEMDGLLNQHGNTLALANHFLGVYSGKYGYIMAIEI